MTEIIQADRALFISISHLTPDGATADKINKGLAFTEEVAEIARHRLAERARIVAWLRTGCMFCKTDQEIADAIERGDA